MNERLYRSVDDRVLAGVAGGLADRMGLDPALVRIVWALLGIFSGGIFVVIYIVMAIVVPEEDDMDFPPVAPTPPVAPMPPVAPGTPAVPGSPEAPGLAAAPGTASGWTQPAPTSGWVTPPAGDWRAQSRAQRRAARAARRAQQGPGQGGVIVGVILILLGTWFLLRQYIPELDLDRLWPFALLILGVLLLAFSVTGRPGGTAGTSGTGSGQAQK